MTKKQAPGGPAGSRRDRLYRAPTSRPADFTFSEEVAAAFDDMVGRSVPFYDEIQRMIVEMASDFTEEDGRVFDLGCATGTTLAALAKASPKRLHMIGVDSSQEMLQRAQRKLAPFSQHHLELRQADLNGEFSIADASVVLMVLTLQFIRPLHRERMLRSIFEGLKEDGCLILVEKVVSTHSLLNRLFIQYYYDLKRRADYNDMEIAQKREALENVLVPYRMEENLELLRRIGFEHTDIFFKWYNFCGLLAVK